MIIRPRRLRVTQAIRDMTSETRLSPSMLIYPVFVREGKNIIEDIPQIDYAIAKQAFIQLGIGRYMHEHYTPLP